MVVIFTGFCMYILTWLNLHKKPIIYFFLFLAIFKLFNAIQKITFTRYNDIIFEGND